MNKVTTADKTDIIIDKILGRIQPKETKKSHSDTGLAIVIVIAIILLVIWFMTAVYYPAVREYNVQGLL